MTRSSSALLLAAATAATATFTACGDSAGPVQPTALVLVSGDNQAGRVGEALAAPLVVRATDAGGKPVGGAAITFAVAEGNGSVAAGSVTTAADGTAQSGWTLGTSVADLQRVRASLSAVTTATVTFRATATAAAPVNVVAAAGNGQSRPAGGTLADPLAARVTDTYGNPNAGVQVNWTVTAGGGTLSPPSSITDGDGVARTHWTLGPAIGAQTAQAAVTNVSTASFTAQAVQGPTVTQISPDPVVPGGVAVITGTNFSAVAAENVVSFNGSLALVQQASPTQLSVVVPCEPSGPVTVTVSSAGAPVQYAHRIMVDNPLSLNVGQAFTFAAGSVCRELATPGRYALTVAHATSGNAATTFRLRGAAASSDAPTAASVATNGVTRPLPRLAMLPEELRHREAHGGVLEANLQLLARLGSPPRASERDVASLSARVARAQIAVNDTLTLKIPTLTNLCSGQTQVKARVVFVGTRAVVLEDIAAPLAGQMDSIYRFVGQEFETIHYDIVKTNFADPLALDAQTDGNGKMFMLFSEVVNNFESVAGFVSSGDFFPPALCNASNYGEIFYGIVATSAAAGYGDGAQLTAQTWARLMRSIVIHETKHVASFADRINRNPASPNYEEGWLEEATAVVAEELFARAIFGYAQHANNPYESSLFCEVRPNPSSANHPTHCWHSPFVMFGYFRLLYQYLSSIETLSPMGPISAADGTYYASGWWLLRWAADQYGGDEAAFFRALTQEPTLRGIRNLELRTGRMIDELLANWAVATLLDDVTGLVNTQQVHSVTSWNTRDVFARMRQDFPALFPNDFPLAPRQLTYGNFAVEVTGLRAGTVSVFELSGTPGGPQLLQLTGAFGNSPSQDLRLRLVRIE